MREKGIVIAIDGPAGVGKSSIGGMLALKLNYSFLSTGQMYRALAWKADKEGVDLSDETAIMKLARGVEWDFKSDEKPILRVVIDGTMMNKQISDERVGKATSAIAKLREVRKFMCEKQREIGVCGGIVMEGRDIGSNVFPDAEIKVYLDASPDERAGRRVRQLAEQNIKSDYDEILSLIIKRDKQDVERKHNPLKKSAGCHYVDSTNLNMEEVVDEIYGVCEKYISQV